MVQYRKMHEKQISNLLKQSPKERYEFFIRYCAGFEEVWGLVVNEVNWIIFKDNEGDEIFPVWPHKDLAEKCIFDEHNDIGAIPKSITLQSFLEMCAPDMASQNVYFGVFYDTKRQGLVVTADKIKADLQREVESIWE